jgi:hypothetical protein
MRSPPSKGGLTLDSGTAPPSDCRLLTITCRAALRPYTFFSIGGQTYFFNFNLFLSNAADFAA